MESEELPFHRRVREGYLDFARQEPDRYHVVDATQAADAVAGEVATVTMERALAHGVGRRQGGSSG
jgi:dTMP kinase